MVVLPTDQKNDKNDIALIHMTSYKDTAASRWWRSSTKPQASYEVLHGKHQTRSY